MELVQVSLYPFGAYFIYKINVQRGIKGKTKSKVDELIVVGVNKKRLQNYCIKEEIVITNKAVYLHNDMNNPVLYADGKGNYLIRETQQLL